MEILSSINLTSYQIITRVQEVIVNDSINITKFALKISGGERPKIIVDKPNNKLKKDERKTDNFDQSCQKYYTMQSE